MRFVAISFILLSLISCTSHEKEGDDKNEADEQEIVDEITKAVPVTVMTLTRSEFMHELVSNGNAKGHNRAEVYFPQGDHVITEILVKNGQHVKKGDQLAKLDTYDLEIDIENAKRSLNKSDLNLKDALIGQGYDPDKPQLIPEKVLRLARLRSGYDDAEAALSLAQHRLEQTIVTAPFDGVISNLTAKVFNKSNPSAPLCTLIGETMDVTFKILESELKAITPGDAVSVKAFSNSTTYPGVITEINPMIDTDGLVTVMASVSNPKGLYDGMKVKVVISKPMGNELVVPKSAVLTRNGRLVVFTLSDDNRAVWNYVETGLENLDSYSIVDGLQEGMKVIVSGNLNLAHETLVSIE